MMYTVAMQYKDSWFALPQEKSSEATRAAVAYHDKYREEGKLKETYTYADGKLLSIWSVESFEDMLRIVRGHPYWGLVDVQTEPCLDGPSLRKLMVPRGGADRKAPETR